MVFRGFHTVDLPPCPPFQMFTNGDDPISEYILNRTFEPHSMRVWCQLVSSATSITDIGAHVGIYSLAAASLRKDIKIHAFEPNPFTAARLRVNKHLNEFDHIIEHNVALAKETGVGKISWVIKPNGWLAAGAGFGTDRDGEQESAPAWVAPLDSFGLEPGSRPIMKIDVEGAEAAVFAGMREFLKSRPTIILETFFQEACDMIMGVLPDYAFFLIKEAGKLAERDRLIACDFHDSDKNYLLLPKEHRHE